MATGEVLHTVTTLGEWITNVAFSPDGSRIASVSSGWQQESGDPETKEYGNLMSEKEDERPALEDSKENKERVSEHSRRNQLIEIRDAASGRIQQVLADKDAVEGSFFPPAGRCSTGKPSMVPGPHVICLQHHCPRPIQRARRMRPLSCLHGVQGGCPLSDRVLAPPCSNT